MAEISWIKLKTMMFDDEKIKLIQAMPQSDAILIIWIRLLILAGKTNDEGIIYVQKNMPYTEEGLSILFNKETKTIQLALATLEEFNMIERIDGGFICISKWEKHQNIDGMEQIRRKNAERNRKYRERKKKEQQLLEKNAGVTSRDTTEIDSEIDIEVDGNKDKETVTSKKAAVTHVLHMYGNYQNVPLSYDQLSKLKHEFPDDWEQRINIVSEYCESTGKAYKNYLATIRNWAKKDKRSAKNNTSENKQYLRRESIPNWANEPTNYSKDKSTITEDDLRRFLEDANEERF
ncbi:phage replisome organizer N-terminal domain-containing protein [Enterococcus casseliflavus]|uniref:phage replisome organizer N-terminal domain-containing protein n=4 Tax=Enterococcus TaxID=1350 RepID=UPI001432F20C|nr:phage replisome organizer N-terminal domain-containing protein [Enterococcus casseliflavus]NKD32937.1 hypothetical protein [Enterococcus casseliflavus]